MSKKSSTYEARSLKDKEFSFPSYMTILSQSKIDSLSNGDERVFAAGVHPEDNSLNFVTTAGRVLSIEPNGVYTPETAVPSGDGKHICLTFMGMKDLKTVDVKYAIRVGKDLIRGGELFVNGKKFLDI